jgi:hypothetical protein
MAKAKLTEAAGAGSAAPDLNKRGAIRALFDGRYRFARYFSPRQRHRQRDALERSTWPTIARTSDELARCDWTVILGGPESAHRDLSRKPIDPSFLRSTQPKQRNS